MQNSSLIDCTNLSPNHSGKRNHTVDRITPHCFVGQVSVERGLEVFEDESIEASCNYLIGTDGRLGLCVQEDNRSWCSSSASNDHRAITIECASDTQYPYAFNEQVYNKLIELCVDICKRYNKKKLLWIENEKIALTYNPQNDEMLLTIHRWFANKACPGMWLYTRLGELANIVTSRLSNTKAELGTIYKVQVGAFKNMLNATNQKAKLEGKGYDCFIVCENGFYKVQVGAFRNKENAINLQKQLGARGYSCYVTKKKGVE